jgi:hypothetical protein
MPNLPTLDSTTPVNCWKCRFFATSWDPKLPYSCKLLGFKSRMMPAQQVLALDGRPCQGFDAKPMLMKPVQSKPGLAMQR